MIQLGAASYDPSAQLVRDSAGAKIALRPQSLKVLDCLLKADGNMVGKDELVKAVWGKLAVTDDSLVQCVREIRAAIGDQAHQILQTEHRRGYRLVANVRAGLSSPASTIDGQATPAIAVMAFTSMEGDERSERLAMRFAGDLTDELAHDNGLRVINRVSALSVARLSLSSKEMGERLNARFLVIGQIQMSATRCDVSLELLDGPSEQIIWSERKPYDVKDGHAGKAALVRHLVGSMAASCKRFIWRQNLAKPADTLNAYDLAAKVLATLFLGSSRDTTREAQNLAHMAVKQFPGYASAWRVLAQTHAFDINCSHTGLWTDERTGEALAEIHKSIELETDNPSSLTTLADLQLSNGQLDEALLASDRARQLAPAEPLAANMRAILMFQAGRFDEARAISESILSMVPIPPAYFYANYGRILWALGERSQALEVLKLAVTLNPKSIAHLTLTVIHHESGATELAAEHFQHLLKVTTGLDERHFGRRWEAIPELRTRSLNALREYGLKRRNSDMKVPLSLVQKA